MPTKNDITGDAIKSKTSTENYLNNYDRIFNKEWKHTCESIGIELKLPKSKKCSFCDKTYN